MGYVIMLNGGPIMWSSVLGKTVAMSTCEAEVNAAVSASKDALHLNRMLAELGYSNGKPLQIAEDNAACTVLLTPSQPYLLLKKPFVESTKPTGRQIQPHLCPPTYSYFSKVMGPDSTPSLSTSL